jgi:hypothetical protein
MATFKVYKFRGHDFRAFAEVSVRPTSGENLDLVWPVSFSVVGDLYFDVTNEGAGISYRTYLLHSFFSAFMARYGGEGSGSVAAVSYDTHYFSGPPPAQPLEVSSYVEPTHGNLEVVYRRCRLEADGTLYLYLSTSPEVLPGEVDLGPLARPAPRTLFSDEVAENFRSETRRLTSPDSPCDCR